MDLTPAALAVFLCFISYRSGAGVYSWNGEARGLCYLLSWHADSSTRNHVNFFFPIVVIRFAYRCKSSGGGAGVGGPLRTEILQEPASAQPEAGVNHSVLLSISQGLRRT